MTIDEQLRELAEKRYGTNPNSFGGQRDGFIEGYKAALKQVKNIAYEPVLLPVIYTDDYLNWIDKYFKKVNKVFEYSRINKDEYFTKEQLYRRYEKAMLESPFK